MVGNVISQSAKQYPFQASAYANFVICGKNGVNPWDIREKFLNNQMSLSEALSKLAGFYTTLKVWKNRKNFYHYVVKTYKKRWNIESGIRDMNKIHETSRARKYTTKLAGLLLRAFIYNLWQFWREARANAGYRKASSTQAIFLEVLKHIVSKAYISDIVLRF
ncbi:MAG: transposase [Promethearchaeota archaeon]